MGNEDQADHQQKCRDDSGRCQKVMSAFHDLDHVGYAAKLARLADAKENGSK